MTPHKFLWNKSIDGHTCDHCGMTRQKASDTQYRARYDALDAWQATAPDASVSQGITAHNAPVFTFGVSTSQGYAQYRAIIDATGVTVANGYFVDMRPVESVPESFRKFHAAHTKNMLHAMRDYAVTVWAVNAAEDNGECP